MKSNTTIKSGQNIEKNIRRNALLIACIVALLCSGIIFYAFFIKQGIDTERESVEKNMKQLSEINHIISTINEAQNASNAYIFDGNIEHFNKFKLLSDSIIKTIDNYSNHLSDSAQIVLLQNIGVLLQKKEIVIGTIFDQKLTIKESFEQVKTEPIPSSGINLSKILFMQVDSITIASEKKGFFRRLANVFVPEKNDDKKVSVTQTASMADTTTTDGIAQQEANQRILKREIEKYISRAQIKYADRLKNIQERMFELIVTDQSISMDISELLIKLHNETLNATLDKIDMRDTQWRKGNTFSLAMICIGGVLILISISLIIFNVGRANMLLKNLAIAKKQTEDLMQSRHKLLLSVTHDVKAPLTSILGYLELFKTEKLSSAWNERFSSMENSGKHILALLANLLKFSSLEQGKLKEEKCTFDLNELCAEVVEMFQPLAIQKNLSFVFEDKTGDGKFIIGDELKIKQIIINILSNSIKYTNAGEIKFSAELTDRKLCIRISDTGIGIPKEKMANLGEAFSRIEGQTMAEGSGFGLFVVKGLVDLINGKIDVNSEVGKGTAVTISIPAEKSSGIAKSSKENTAAHLSVNKKIFIIDDDIFLLKMLTEVLHRMGCTIIIGSSLESLRKKELATCDIILTDMDMGVFTGKDVLQKIREMGIAIPVIVMTAKSNYNDKKAKSEGFDGFLAKPFSMNSLAQILGEKTNKEFVTLEEMFDGDEETIKKILNLFVENTGENLKSLQQFVSADDFTSAQTLCHKMLPMFAQLNAVDLAAFLSKIDGLRGQDATAYPTWKEEMRQFIKNAAVFIETLSC